MRERSTSESGTDGDAGVVLHPETFEISQQQVLGWLMSHSTRMPYHVLATTYRTYAPDIGKIISVLKDGIQEKKSDMIKYASDHSYVIECREFIALYEKTLNMIQETSRDRQRKQEERDQRLVEIDVLSRDRISRARERDRRVYGNTAQTL
jgi:hypothetical protein